MLISKKLIKKVEGKQIKINGKGKPVFYYEPGEKLLTEDDTQKNITKTYIIQDQFKNNYDYPSDELLEEKLEQLIYDNPKLELSIYKKVKTVKAYLKIITTHTTDTIPTCKEDVL